MQMWHILLGLLVIAMIGAAIGIRLMPVPVTHHVDPATVEPPTSPNFVLRRGAGAASLTASLAQTAEQLDAVIGRAGGVLLAGDLAQGHASYVFRSRIFGFPDVLSIRLTDASVTERLAEGAITEIEVFSRALMGYGDLGVNRARLDRLLSQLGS